MLQWKSWWSSWKGGFWEDFNPSKNSWKFYGGSPRRKTTTLNRQKRQQRRRRRRGRQRKFWCRRRRWNIDAVTYRQVCSYQADATPLQYSARLITKVTGSNSTCLRAIPILIVSSEKRDLKSGPLVLYSPNDFPLICLAAMLVAKED